MNPHGFLQATVCVWGLGLPIPNAQVKIYKKGASEPTAILLSDQNGNIKKTVLPCPARTDSPAYAYYELCSDAPDYLPHCETVPIFDGVTSFASLPLKKERKAAE